MRYHVLKKDILTVINTLESVTSALNSLYHGRNIRAMDYTTKTWKNKMDSAQFLTNNLVNQMQSFSQPIANHILWQSAIDEIRSTLNHMNNVLYDDTLEDPDEIWRFLTRNMGRNTRNLRNFVSVARLKRRIQRRRR